MYIIPSDGYSVEFTFQVTPNFGGWVFFLLSLSTFSGTLRVSFTGSGSFVSFVPFGFVHPFLFLSHLLPSGFPAH